MAGQVAVKTVKKVNLKHMFLIAVILIAVLAFGKLTHFFGKYTGEVADDGRMFNKLAAAWDGPQESIALEDGTTVYLPEADRLAFDSEETEQPLSLGNPKENDLVMNLTVCVQDKDICSSGLLEPGRGLDRAETNAYFQPSTYEGTVVYTFYRLDGHRLNTAGTVEKPITIQVTGSGEKYQEGIEKNNQKK